MPGLKINSKQSGYVVQWVGNIVHSVLWEDKGDENFEPMTQEDASTLQIAIKHQLGKCLYCTPLIQEP